MSCAAERGDFPAWNGRVVDPQEEITPEANVKALLNKIFELDAQYQGGIIKAPNRIEFIRLYLCPLLIDALDQEYRRGVEESLAATRSLRYRPITPDETR